MERISAYAPLADVALGPLELLPFVIMLGVVSAIEAGVLWLLKWEAFRRCVVLALTANTASGIFGTILFAVFKSPTWKGDPEWWAEEAEKWNRDHPLRASGWFWFASAFLLSVVIEAIVLAVMAKRSGRHASFASLLTNAATYAPLLILGLLLIAAS